MIESAWKMTPTETVQRMNGGKYIFPAELNTKRMNGCWNRSYFLSYDARNWILPLIIERHMNGKVSLHYILVKIIYGDNMYITIEK